jgi:HU domain fused to wHTH, Ig, or Glycine-rich motif
MAKLIEAIRQFGPRIKFNPTLPVKELAAWIAMRTSLNESQVMMVLDELREAVLYFNRAGTPVKLPGLGWFAPSIKRDGTFSINIRPDPVLRKGINAEDAFYGEIKNRSHIGLDNQGYKVLWDSEFPDNPLEI